MLVEVPLCRIGAPTSKLLFHNLRFHIDFFVSRRIVAITKRILIGAIKFDVTDTTYAK